MKTRLGMVAAILCIAGMLGTSLVLGQTKKPSVASPIVDTQMPMVKQAANTLAPQLMSITTRMSTATVSGSMAAGGDRLVAMQYTDGSWGWPLTAPPTYANIVGPIAMGLAQAYQQTGNAAQRTALVKAGAYLMAKTNNFSPSDGYLAAQLDRVLGVMTYKTHVMTNFYAPLAAGTYNRNGAGVLYTTASYVSLIRTNRGGTQANLAAWDLGMGLVGAASCGASTADWIAGVKAEINELDGNYLISYYDVIGLAGAVYGLAYVHEDFDPTAGQHAAASNINDLANILAGYQIAGGGFAWNQAFVIPSDGDEAIQETAYSILALNEVNRTAYLANIQGAANYMMNVQLGTGGWRNYEPPSTSGENNEVTAEALWGISTAFPAPVHNITKDVYYPTIQGGISDASTGNTITVAAGTYRESLDISKSLTILGAGQATTFIDQSANAAAGNVVYIHGACGDVKVDGFTIKTGTASSVACNGVCVSGLTAPGTITISNNTIWGNQSAVKDNLCLIAGYFSITTPKLVFDHNTVHGGWSSSGVANPILIERWMGPTEITNNTIDHGAVDGVASDVIVFLNADYGNVTEKQLVSGNTIDMGWGTTYDAAHRGAGITFWGGYNGGTLASGYTNLAISGNTLVNLKPSRRGISLYNSSGGDGSGGSIAGAVISGNTVSNAIGYSGEFGIRVRGKATGTQITNNLISGVNDAVLIAPQSGHEPASTSVNNNSLLATTGYGLNNTTATTIDATCNWWGSTVPLTIASSIHGPAIPVPWLASGVDNETGTPGFQPKIACSSCNDVTVSISVTSAAFCSGTTLTAVPSPAGVYTYSWTGDGTTASKVLTNADPDGDYQVTVTKDNGCTASATYSFAKQNVLSSYVILGLKDVKLGENNIVTGSVGNTAAGKKVAIDKNSTVGGFVKASVIALTQPVTVTGGLFTSPAVVTLPPMQYNTASVPKGNFSVPDNATATVTGNYNDLTIGKNATVTVSGTIYDKIVVKEGALVTFTAPVIDINNLDADAGKANSGKYTTMNFSGATVRVKDKVAIGDRNRVNGSNTTFYLGDLTSSAEKFTVKGNDTRVTANVYMPHGKLNVQGKAGPCIMTGKYIAEEIESDNTVTWIGYDCAPALALSYGEGGQEVATGLGIQSAFEASSVHEIPTAFSLGQNYPNPFNPATTIQFALPTASFTTLKIFNMFGQEVAVLVNGVRNAGTHSVRWNAADLPSGVYFYQLQAGAFSETKKLILQK